MSPLIVNNQYNIGHICTRQQCDLGMANKVAMRWLPAKGASCDYTFRDLDQQSNRFANTLGQLGLVEGEVLFTFLPKLPEQFFAFLGSLKMRLITGTLFANFGEDALLDRLGDAKAKVVVTKKSLAKKIIKIRSQLPALRYIILVDIEEHQSADILSFSALVNAADSCFETPLTRPETPSVLHYTSGSTGKPKGVLHAHRSVLFQHETARDVLGLKPDDIFWCTADQGWVTGTSYGIIGPWSMGVTQIHYGGMYDAAEWFRILEQEKINVWYTAPTALRMLMREEDKVFSPFNLSSLRYISSVGEPLNPEVIKWAKRVVKKDIYDTWFQTETGAIMITNRPGLQIRPGSMGQPVAGIEPAILDEKGCTVAIGEQGNLCLKSGWPSMFITYLNNNEVYQQKFRDGYYYTGDTARKDVDGYYWFMGRSDDVINTGGHLISPFEIESALLELDEVVESGAIGAPDELLFEKVVVFVHLHQGVEWSHALEMKMRLHLSQRVSSIATPQDVVCVESIPKNKSGKIMRRVLKARYLGQDEGDLSTLED